MSVTSVEKGFVAPTPATQIARFSRGREVALRCVALYYIAACPIGNICYSTLVISMSRECLTTFDQMQVGDIVHREGREGLRTADSLNVENSPARGRRKHAGQPT